VEESLRLSLDEERVRETESSLVLDFLEAVEVELADEAFELRVAKEERGDLGLHLGRV
jgi:hypothetical protein